MTAFTSETVQKPNISSPELLAPAGDMEAMRAAVANGADAVYFGLSEFNARHRATNFSLEELPQTMHLPDSFSPFDGMQRIVALVSFLTCSSHFAEPHQCDHRKPPASSISPYFE